MFDCGRLMGAEMLPDGMDTLVATGAEIDPPIMGAARAIGAPYAGIAGMEGAT
jgi:hypothetical protein